ncbi:MAG: iron ABC transporter permease [Planctomycetes bacterium]|nr:iron ABC transporter permease [Planctomycetota bacterium]
MGQRRAIVGAAIGLFALLSLLPPLLLLASAFSGEEGFTAARLQNLLLDSRQLGLLWNSIQVGAGSALVAALIGAPVAWLLSRTDLPLKGAFTLLAVAPIIVPPYVTGIAYTELVNELVRELDLTFLGIAGIPGCIFLEAASLFPLVVLLAAKGFRSVDGAAEEAALLARGCFASFLAVTLRLALPAILAGTLFVFVFAFSDFSIPDFLSFAATSDRPAQVFATEVYLQFATYRSSPDAAAASLPLVLLVVLAVLLLLRLEGRGDYVVPGTLRVQPAERRLGAWKGPAVFFMILVSALGTLLPLVQLLRWALRAGPRGRLAAFDAAFLEAGGDIGRSLLLSAGAGLLMAAIGFLVAYGVVRGRSRRASRLLAALALLPVAFPAVMMSIGQIRFWNHPLNPLADLVYPSSVLVLLTYAGRFLPFAVLTLRASLRSVDPALEDASALAGRGFARTLARVTGPAAARGLATAVLVGFLLSMRELDTVTLLPAGSDTLPHRVYSMVHTSRDSIIAALCLVLVTASAVPLLIYRFVLARKVEVI